ncbi:MAG: hypothetical protein K6T67_14345 [Alicyclobacillus sp.]|nr:hypothetical protein [Alicyclobacillus sp.]
MRRVYLLSVEEPGDYVFTPEGVVVLLENGHFQLYCPSASHNRFRAALNRFSWDELENGVVYRDASMRLTDITADMALCGWTDPSSVPAMLRHLYRQNPKHLHFLRRVVTGRAT